jgi:predicted acetyltransferase
MQIQTGNYEQFVQREKERSEGKNLAPWKVAETLYFLTNDAGKIVWAETIRHKLNDELRFDTGNIWYSIRPSERKKWYATIGLKLALEKCKEMGMHKVLLTCKQDNVGSSKAIILNGGIRDSSYEIDRIKKDRYRISIS